MIGLMVCIIAGGMVVGAIAIELDRRGCPVWLIMLVAILISFLLGHLIVRDLPLRSAPRIERHAPHA